MPIGVSARVRWLSRLVSTVRSRCIRSWSVPNAAIDPMKPFRSATHTMFGSLRIRRQKSLAPGAGPQLTRLRRPAAPAT